MPTRNELAMLAAARAKSIASRDELANIMAQLGHETRGFVQLEESFRYTRGIDAIPVRSAFREGRAALEAARRSALDGRPQELARLMYGGRMGNDDAGDGYLYRGRGFTMLTGEDNYRQAGTALDLDLVGHPELASDRSNAARVALWYWQERVPVEQRVDVSAAAFAINGGENGLADRHDRFDAWYAVLTPEFITDLDAGRLIPDTAVAPVAGREPMADGALRRFERGADVSRLQRDLQAIDARDARGRAIAATGIYDQATEQAVRYVQQARGMTVTGRAGPETLAAIREAADRQPDRPHGQEPAQHGTEAGRDAPAPASPAVRGAQRHHLDERDARLLDALFERIGELDLKHGRAFDAGSERMGWSLLALAKEHGIGRADHVVVSKAAPGVAVGENLFVVQGDLEDPAHRLAHMKTAAAIRQPVEASLARIGSVDAQQAEITLSDPARAPVAPGRVAERPMT